MKHIIATLLVLVVFLNGGELKKIPSWYYDIKDVKVQKKEFFNILKPLIERSNKEILKERDFVEKLFDEYGKSLALDDKKLKRLTLLAKKYRIKNLYNKEEYLRKIDTIPTSLVLAQAALESGWGKSRFAKEANNLFGEWTWGKKGLIPKKRDAGKKHKIKIFESIYESVASYMLNLNRHRAYKEFRVARLMAKKAQRKFSGIEAAMTMKRYSQIGNKYTKIVATIIRKNRLHLD